MAKIVYGKRDTATVVSIEKAPQSIQTLWNASNVLGVNIVRVRANKERYETTAGRRTPLGKDNKGMQILEVATNIDVQDTLKVVSDYEYYTANSFFARLKMTFTRLFA